jgi:hypothetical protein
VAALTASAEAAEKYRNRRARLTGQNIEHREIQAGRVGCSMAENEIMLLLKWPDILNLAKNGSTKLSTAIKSARSARGSEPAKLQTAGNPDVLC